MAAHAGVRKLLDVGTRGERLVTGAPQHHRPQPRFAGEIVQQPLQPTPARQVECVLRLRMAQRDQRNVSMALQRDTIDDAFGGWLLAHQLAHLSFDVPAARIASLVHLRHCTPPHGADLCRVSSSLAAPGVDKDVPKLPARSPQRTRIGGADP